MPNPFFKKGWILYSFWFFTIHHTTWTADHKSSSSQSYSNFSFLRYLDRYWVKISRINTILKNSQQTTERRLYHKNSSFIHTFSLPTSPILCYNKKSKAHRLTLFIIFLIETRCFSWIWQVRYSSRRSTCSCRSRSAISSNGSRICVMGSSIRWY